MTRLWLVVGSVCGFLAVLAGAFATHGLERSGLPDAARLFDTATRYQFWHALALISVAWIVTLGPTRRLANFAGAAFLLGIVLFSGSLYLYALTGISALVFVTPAGGISFLVGWALLALAAFRLK